MKRRKEGLKTYCLTMDKEYLPTKTKRVPEDSTEELIEKLKERDITKEQAHELEDFIYPFNHWKENQWEEKD